MNTLATARGALAVPDFLKDVHGNAGLENVKKEDLILPRLAICQSSNDERKKSKDKYIEGLNDGDFFNSLTQEIYGTSVMVIPLSFSKSRVYFKPPVGSGIVLCRSLNSIDGGTIAQTCAACPNSKYVNDDPPICTLFANFPVMLLPNGKDGEVELLLMSLKSTALTAAKQWTSRMKSLNKPAYSSLYEIHTVETTKTKGTFFAPIITRKGFITSEELYFAAEKQFNELKGVTIAVEETNVHEDQDDDQVEEDEKTPF